MWPTPQAERRVRPAGSATGGGPTEDKPGVVFTPPDDRDRVSHQLTLRVPDCHEAYAVLKARGAELLTPPIDRGGEIRCFFRDPDGHLLEISEVALVSTRSPAVVLDTNVFVAAAFRPESDSARVIAAIRQGRLRLIWHESTRRETERLLHRIPPVSWEAVDDLFQERHRFTDDLHPGAYDSVPDPDDRKFAALAVATGAILVSLDKHLLDAQCGDALVILNPSAFLARR